MKTSCLWVLTLALSALVPGLALAQATGEYRTFASGSWNDPLAWERFDGSAWVAAVSSPTSADNVITIQSGHAVTVTANVTVDQVAVASGAQLILNPGITLTLNNGTGTDLSVSGTFTSAGSTAGTGTIVFAPGSFYQHNFTTTAGTIPTATWNAGSTCEITGYTTNTAAPSGLGQSFSNFTWNAPLQTGTISAAGAPATVSGTFTMTSTGTGAFRFGTTTSPALTIGGNFVQTGGTCVLTGSTGSPTMTLAGNFSVSGGVLRLSEGSGIGTINVSGDFSHTAGTITETSTGSGALRFAKSGTQLFTGGGTIQNSINFTVNSGSILEMGVNILTGGGTFTLSSGATLGIGSPAGIASSGATGNIQVTGSRTYSTGASYIYNAGTTQDPGNGLPATVRNLTLDNPAGLTLTGPLTATGDVLLTQGTLTINNLNLSVGGNWTNNGGVLSAGTGTVTFTGAAKTVGGGTATAFPGLAIAAGSTITLATNATATGLTFAAGSTASSLTQNPGTDLSISGNVTVNQPTASVAAAWNINQGIASVTGNVAVGGANTTTARVARVVITTGSLTIGGNLTFNSSGSTAGTAVIDMSTGGGTGTLNLAGLFTLTNNTGTLLPGSSGSVFNFNGGVSAQTVVLSSAITYHNLHLNNTSPSGAALGAAVTISRVTGNLRIQSGQLANGGFAVAGNASRTFEVADGATYRLTGTTGMVTGFGTKIFGQAGTVEYAGSGAQTIAAESYGNLAVTGARGAANVTLAGTGSIGIRGTFAPAATFTTGSYSVSGSTVDYNGTGTQTVAAFGYQNLTLSGVRGASTITLSPSGTIGIQGGFTPSASFTGGAFIPTGSTIDFNGAAQTIPVFPYHHLATNGSGTKTTAAGLTVNGDLTIGTGTTLSAGTFSYILKGNLSHNGTLSAATSTVEFSGPSAQTLSGNGITFSTLRIDNPAGVTMAGLDAGVTGTLHLLSGNLKTGANTLVIPLAGSATRTAGHVEGNLRRAFAPGTTLQTFDIGGATTYAPVTLSFAGLTGAGDVTVHTTAGDHPSIATSGIRAARSVNRHYTLTNSGVVFSTFDATFGFGAADVDPGANTGAFVVRRFAAPAWFQTTVGARTSTSTQATGIAGFGEFQVGEGGAAFPGTSIVDALPASVTANGSSSATITVRLKDDQGNNLTSGGDAVSVTPTLGTAGSVTDNNNGTYSALLTSTVTGTSIVRASVNTGQITDTALVQFTPGPVSLATSTITADPEAIIANGGSTSRITVQLKDAFGNNLTSGAGTVLLATTRGSLGAVTDSANGRYSAILTASTSIDSARITGTLNGNPFVDDARVAFVAGVPVSLAWVRDPRDTVAGTVLPGTGGSPAVEIRDVSGFRVLNATDPVTVSFASNPGGASLGGNTTRNAVNGLVVFDNLTVNKAAAGYTLAASSGALSGDTSAAFTILPAAPAALVFSQQPTTTVTGQPISPAVVVRTQDAFGNNTATTGISITVALVSGTGTLSGTTTRSTDSSGAATFTDLSISQVGSKRLSATSAGLTGTQSNFFTIIVVPSVLVSDDFNSYALNQSVWTVFNPLGDAHTAMTGTNTANAALTLAVPGGINHDASDGGLRVPRIMQAANNTDFEAEAKFLTPVTQRFQLQGFIVEQDSLNFLRFDFDSDGLNTKVFASKVIAGIQTQIVYFSIGGNGLAPQYMRVRRVGNDWTQFYSLNGTSWNPTGTFTHAITVQRVGLFAGNTNTVPPAPAHTSSFDYFFNTSAPIVPEDGGTAVDSIPPAISALSIAADDTSATFTWVTDDSSNSSVAYGHTPALELDTLTTATFTNQHSIRISGLSGQTSYHFRVTSTDQRGNTGMFPDSVFTTLDSSSIISDDFNTYALGGHWTFLNPRSDASYVLTGQNTPDAWVRISVPGGIAHEPWISGNTAAWLAQAANDRDFGVEARFDSPVTLQYQTQGIVVEQDSVNFLRYEVYSNGSGTMVFAGTVVNGVGTTFLNTQVAANGVAPQYLRIIRLGSLWELWYSLDGLSWTPATTITQTFAVRRVGPYAGNSGTSAPAHTAVVDYFFKTSSPVNPEDGGSAGGNSPPLISNVQTSTSGTAATISWITDEPASSLVMYGLTPAHESGAAGDSTLTTLHSVMLHSLTPDTVYHFRLRSNDVYGDSSFTPDSTFVTGPASTVVSDDFNAFVLDTLRWRYYNPLSDATLTMRNPNTDSARVFLSVPGGISHQPWTGGNKAPRIMQACANTDFEVEVKFESPVSQRYQIQGIIVEQGAADYLRFDLSSDGSTMSAYAASISAGTPTSRISFPIGANGAAPQWMRVRREGNLWTQLYSLDGVSWIAAGSFTHVLAVDSIGPFAGNTGTTVPAHTAKIDYFFNIRSPILPEDGGIAPDPLPPVFSAIHVSATPTTATVTWTSDERSSSAVSYGPTTAYENGTVTDPALSLTHSITLTGLTPSTPYHFRIAGTDSSGNTGTSPDSLFTTRSSSIIVSDDFNDPALDTTLWGFVNPLSDGTLAMANTGTDSAWVLIGVPAGVAHDIWTTGRNAPRIMQPANNVDFEVEAKFDSRMNLRYQTQGILVDGSPTEFLRCNLHSDGSTTWIFVASFAGGLPTTRINTSIGANGAAPQWMRLLRQGNQWTVRYSFTGTSWTTAGTFSYPLTVTAIGPFVGNSGTTIPAHSGKIDYFFNVDSPIIPEDGVPDTTAPVISDVAATPALTSVQVQWTTNEPAQGTVRYGLTTSYELGAITNSSYALSHSLTVPGLQSGVTYQFRIVATDTADNASQSDNLAATTLPPYVTAPLRAFLQGPYDAAGDTMRTDIRNQGLIPLSQPYAVAPWNYSGNESVGVVPLHVVDWVLLELRAAADSSISIARRAGFITRTGSVVDTGGTAPVSFSGVASGSYWVVMKHRNHLGVMTSTPLPLTMVSGAFDFTAAGSSAFGIDPQRTLESGVFGLRSGDGNSDGGVDALDRNLVWRPQNGTTWTYAKYGDFNLDGGIDALDLNLQWRTNNGTASQVPGAAAAAPGKMRVPGIDITREKEKTR